MIEKIYCWVHDATSRPNEKGKISSGIWHDRIRRTALDICRHRSGRLLEAGCGEGLFLAQALKEFPHIECRGVDRQADILFKARQRILPIKPGVALVNADVSAMPFDDAFFDTVVCINTIFNMESIEKVMSSLSEMARVCTSGGRIIFDFRNSLNPFLVLKYRLAKYYDLSTKDLPLKAYHPEKIRAVVRQCGCEIVRERALSFPVNALAPIIVMEAVKR